MIGRFNAAVALLRCSNVRYVAGIRFIAPALSLVDVRPTAADNVEPQTRATLVAPKAVMNGLLLGSAPSSAGRRRTKVKVRMVFRVSSLKCGQPLLVIRTACTLCRIRH